MKKFLVGMLALALVLGFTQATDTSAQTEIKPMGFGHIHG